MTQDEDELYDYPANDNLGPDDLAFYMEIDPEDNVIILEGYTSQPLVNLGKREDCMAIVRQFERLCEQGAVEVNNFMAGVLAGISWFEYVAVKYADDGEE